MNKTHVFEYMRAKNGQHRQRENGEDAENGVRGGKEMSRQQAEEKPGFMLRVASGWIFPVRPLCGSMSSEPCISGIDMCLGRGIII